MTQFTVTGGRALNGRVQVPGDKSISHRALILAALGRGTSRLTGLSDGADVLGTADALRRLGALVSSDGGVTVVEGFGSPRAPGGPLDVGNSGTTMRLLAGMLAPYPLTVELTGDKSLRSRPMDRIAEPLGQMGAQLSGQTSRCLPPVTVHGGALQGIRYAPPVASAQVKSCVLLAGLGASGATVVDEKVPTRLHTEELLARAGASIDEKWTASGHTASGDTVLGHIVSRHIVTVRASELSSIDVVVPGDPSQAAFWVVAATLVPGSDVVVEGVYCGPQRRGFLDVLARMGADVSELASSAGDAYPHTADLHVRSALLSATEVEASEITGLDEVPVLAIAASLASGTTVFRSVGELRVKESDRFAAVLALVRAFGAEAEAVGDDLAVTGVSSLRAAHVDAAGDHRMAMAAVVAGLAAGDQPTTVDSWESVSTSYPAFAHDLRALVDHGPSTASVPS